MRSRPLFLCLVLAAASTTLPARQLRADMSADEQARRSGVAVHVGPTAITVGELEDRIAAVPHFQLRAFGDTPEAVRHNFLDQVIVPEVLYALAAEKAHVGEQLPASNKLLRTRGGATTRTVLAGMRPVTSVSMREVARYYDANRAKFDAPERISIYRILSNTQQDAAAALEQARKEPTLEAFSKLAQQRSVDKSTLLRGGNVGFIAPDGTSNEAGLKVDPAVVRAAARVKDGEFVPEPVPDRLPSGAPGWAVVWRRGTVPAVHRSLQEAAPQIRETLWKEEADAATRKFAEGLRAAHVTELNESLLNGIDILATTGDVMTHHRPGEVPPLGQAGHAVPHPTN